MKCFSLSVYNFYISMYIFIQQDRLADITMDLRGKWFLNMFNYFLQILLWFILQNIQHYEIVNQTTHTIIIISYNTVIWLMPYL